MTEIIKNDVICYETLNIPDGKRIIDCLQKDTIWQFRLLRVSHEEFERIQKAQKEDKLLGHYDACPIVGYNPTIKGEHGFQSSGGLKLSSDDKDILGSFVVEEDKIIYTPSCKFYEERDCFVYSKTDYYTTLSMPEVLEQELMEKEQFLIYMGEQLNGLRYENIFESVSRSEMMKYAVNPDKGKEAYQKILDRKISY